MLYVEIKNEVRAGQPLVRRLLLGCIHQSRTICGHFNLINHLVPQSYSHIKVHKTIPSKKSRNDCPLNIISFVQKPVDQISLKHCKPNKNQRISIYAMHNQSC